MSSRLPFRGETNQHLYLHAEEKRPALLNAEIMRLVTDRLKNYILKSGMVYGK